MSRRTRDEERVRLFLQDHTEHIAGVQWVPGRDDTCERELMLDTEALRAFIAWGAETSRISTEAAAELQRVLDARESGQSTEGK